MGKFFYQLTKRNWGWPYHVIIANTGAIVCMWLLELTKQPKLWMAILTWFVINVFGYINEWKQKENKQAFWEDIVANNLGIILGIGEYVLIN